ncbi:MAG TPA: imidazolonepropionase [Sediminibacterium sp.]|uniref:imidazolonepropionase n=1 Tax=Sediminibacterium sp. TaxID=1917865 RepID=UPI0008C198BF|nr:imidazolonepropionase [Sediminibacterium sp.]OHC84222.1 MAG: imidazolonepropionase [Sphingobacteriia bacterium RIFOXYC2_FULL_35_18]HLD53829.1 imidazolonepropionase [Sediminibacterium sp.]
MKWVIQHIKQLVNTRTNSIVLRGAELSKLPIIDNAFLIVENGIIQAYGAMHELSAEHLDGAGVIDAAGASVLPCWCDSHTHLVFAASREDEFVHKINGLTYAEIAAKGGGILNSARKIALANEEELYVQAMTRLQELMKLGTGAIEIKSGYGLNTANELKMLRVIKRIKETAPIPVKASFLGAHTFPLEFKENHDGYINQIIQEMLPAISQEQLADYIDVFCEEGFFSVAETQRICEAGIAHGLKPKIHANQLHASGGVELGVQLGAISVDHLETMNAAAIQALSNSTTIGTMLPTAAFFLRMPYQPARELIRANAALAIASDYNPGSSPSGNMNFVVALSCIQMKLLPEEAINAATINGAFAMELEKEVGSITIGKRANLIFTYPIPSLAYMPYSFGTNLIDKVMINGRFI